MLGRKRLIWQATDFNQHEAKSDPYQYIIWSKGEYAELRLIRRSNEGGIIVPLCDFSIYAPDTQTAMKVAERIDKALRKVRRYNKITPLV